MPAQTRPTTAPPASHCTIITHPTIWGDRWQQAVSKTSHLHGEIDELCCAATVRGLSEHALLHVWVKEALPSGVGWCRSVANRRSSGAILSTRLRKYTSVARCQPQTSRIVAMPLPPGWVQGFIFQNHPLDSWYISKVGRT